MKRNQKPYSIFQSASAIFMILALLWLTVSAPFVFASQQQLAKQSKTLSNAVPLENSNEEDVANPFGNSTEEKTSNSNSFTEEYLHDHHMEEHFFSMSSKYHKCENDGTYLAYHGELDVPPPDVA
jgi:hypothetical protein